jgi:phosphoribosylformimino-5-aminoimidazole carboxamide ribotide isomerase
LKSVNENSSPNSFIIPAIDIIDGKAVRLTHGDFSNKKIYNAHPLEVAKAFEGAGLKRLHLVDLDGAKAGKTRNLEVLEKIAGNTSLQIDFGGGIKTREDIAAVSNAGAQWITLGSIAVKQPDLLEEWISEMGAGKFFIGADVYDKQIKISGWLEDGGIDINTFLQRMTGLGCNNFFCTDIKMDGALQGTSITLYKAIRAAFPSIRLTASGGVANLNDIVAAKEAGCDAVIIGKAIYEGLVSLNDLSKINSSF